MVMSVSISTSTCLAQVNKTFEGEVVSRAWQSHKYKNASLTQNSSVDMLVDKILSHSDEKEDELLSYNGAYTSKTVYKGKKNRTEQSYDNSVLITVPEGDFIKFITYYPYIKKGYYTTINSSLIEHAQSKTESGKAEKTGETMEILGRKCDVYKVKSSTNNNEGSTVTTMTINDEYAICSDSDMPEADKEYLPGVKGVPLKYTTNQIMQVAVYDGSKKSTESYSRQSFSCQILSITPRAVDDSEFEAPADIKLVNVMEHPGQMKKIVKENNNYIKKHCDVPPSSANEDIVYDDLSQEWDY